MEKSPWTYFCLPFRCWQRLNEHQTWAVLFNSWDHDLLRSHRLRLEQSESPWDVLLSCLLLQGEPRDPDKAPKQAVLYKGKLGKASPTFLSFSSGSRITTLPFRKPKTRGWLPISQRAFIFPQEWVPIVVLLFQNQPELRKLNKGQESFSQSWILASLNPLHLVTEAE